MTLCAISGSASEKFDRPSFTGVRLRSICKAHLRIPPAIDVASSSSWWRLLAGILLAMLLFLGFIAVAAIVRFVRGGKTSSGSNMPVHPMQGLLRLAFDLMGTREPVEAPPKSAVEPNSSTHT
jgi:hypothetical protein